MLLNKNIVCYDFVTVYQVKVVIHLWFNSNMFILVNIMIIIMFCCLGVWLQICMSSSVLTIHKALFFINCHVVPLMPHVFAWQHHHYINRWFDVHEPGIYRMYRNKDKMTEVISCTLFDILPCRFRKNTTILKWFSFNNVNARFMFLHHNKHSSSVEAMFFPIYWF